MNAFIEPPRKISILLRLGIWVSEKITGRMMLPARILAWYPKVAIGSGVLESLVAHKFLPDFIDQIKANFDEREIVILASTAAQVNYWARLIQALGIPPAGYSE